MKRHILLCVAAFLSIMQMEAQTRLIQKVDRPFKAPKDAVVIPFSKYQLANGLTLIVTEDHSDPIVHVDVTYHVGSAREELHKSGFAHLFEHMMFQGSKHVAASEHFHIVMGAGGTMNGTTNRDRTNYFETLPKNYLETALWLEADRMGFLLDAVDQKKFEVQRAVVKNEKGQRYDNVPYGLVGQVADKNFFPFNHPYSWQTIGYSEDLDRVNVDDLKKFFLRWYGPNNATLTVGGDVNTEDVVKLVEKYFGPIPRGPEVKKQKQDYFSLSADRYVSMEDNIRFPMLNVYYPSVPNFHEDEPALDILAELLGQGKSSVLYKDFVKTSKAVSAVSYDACSELAGQFVFSIKAYPGTKLSDIKSMLDQALDSFVHHGISDDDLAKAQAKIQANAIYSLESISGKVSQLALYQTYMNDPAYVTEDIARYTRVTKSDVMRVFQSYIKNAHALYVSVYPKGKKDLIAAPDNYTAGGDSSKIKPMNYDTLHPREVKDNFNRAKQPKPGPSPVVSAPKHFTVMTPNQLKVIATVNNEVPDATMLFNIKAGQVYQPKGKEGIAFLLASMLQESTERMSVEKINDELDKLGTNLSIYAGPENITANVTLLTKNMRESINLVMEILTHPKFDQQEFDLAKKRQLEEIANTFTRGSAMADETFNRLVYGKESPMGGSILGTKESVQSITVDDLRKYFEERFTSFNTSLVISGDVVEGELQHELMLVGAFRPPMLNNRGKIMDSSSTTLPPTPVIDKTRIYVVNKDNAPQSDIRIGCLGLPYDALGDFYKANIMNYPLGGSFNSRINLNLREQKSYTYGVRCGFSGYHFPGTFQLSTAVRGNVTDSSVYEAMKEIKTYHEKGVTKAELKFTKGSMLDQDALKYETNFQKTRFLERLLDYKLNDNYPTLQASILKSIKSKEINNLAKKYLPVDHMVIVVTGDAKKIKPGLSKLGYEVVDIDTYQNQGSK